MSTLNILISSTRQWCPGDEFILFGVQNLLDEVLRSDINWILYDRNPDLFVNGWVQPTHKNKFWSNVFPREDFAGFDLAVIAGTPEWFGGPMINFYSLVREYAIPLIVLGVGYIDGPIILSEDEIYCFRELARVITVRDKYASKVFSDLEIPHTPLPCPALFAAPQEQELTTIRKLAFILQTDKTLNQKIPTELKDASLIAAVNAKKKKFEVEIVCFYSDEAAEFMSKAILPVRYSYNSYDYLTILKNYDAIISTRLHGAILANSLGKPAILLNRDPRCEGTAALFPFIFSSDPEGVINKLKQIDINSVNKELPSWKKATKQKYINLIGEINVTDEKSTLQIRRFRSKIQSTLKAKNARINDLETSLQEKEARIAELEICLQEKDTQVQRLESHIQQIHRSIPMQLVSRYQKLVEKLLHTGTRCRRYYDLGLVGIGVILNEGWKSFFIQVKARLSGKKR